MADPRVAPATKGVEWKKCYKHDKADKYQRQIVLLSVLAFAFQPAMGEKPWFIEQPDHVVFRSKLCQSLTTANLINMMGSNFDNKRMALDKKHAIMSGDTGFQEEDSNIAEEYMLWKFKESSWVDQREENVQNNAEAAKEKLEARFVKRQTWLPQRKVLNRHADNYTQTLRLDSYTFMHRRRRQSHGNVETQSQATDYNIKYRGRSDYSGNSFNNKENNNDDGSVDAKDRTATNSMLLHLFYGGKDKKHRRKSKHKLRKSEVDLNKPLPWHCEFRQRKQWMNKGVFPEWVLDGRCERGKCFHGLFNCVPIKYTQKLLQRDPSKCNPLPSISNATVYEERWQLVQKYITVGCNCGT